MTNYSIEGEGFAVKADGLDLAAAVAKAIAATLPGVVVEVRRASGGIVPGHRYIAEKVERVEVRKAYPHEPRSEG